MTALRAVLLYTAIHSVATLVDHALCRWLAPYGRSRKARRRRRAQRPVYANVLRKAALSFAIKILLDAALAVSKSIESTPSYRRGVESPARSALN